MNTFLDALLPVFSIIVIGYIFKLKAFPGDAFWPQAARITYFGFFPALLINRLATAQFDGLAIGPFALALIIPVLALSFVLVAVKPGLRVTNPAFTSIFQGSIRFNTYVALAVAAALFGDAGVTIAAIALPILIPLVNVLSVLVLTCYVSSGPPSGRLLLSALVTNPLIIACVIGIGLNWTGIGLPFVTGAILEIFGRAALPVGLLTVGAGLDLRAVQASTVHVALTSGLKLLVLPLLTAGVCVALHLDGLVGAVAVLYASLPGAPSAFILAQQLGGDVKLMAGITTVQTILAVATMPLVVLLWS